MSWHDFLDSRFSIIMPIIYVDHKPLLAFIYVLNIHKADLSLALFSYHLSMNNEHDTRLFLDWIRQNTHYFFNDHFTLIEKFRTCVEQTCFSKHYSFLDLNIIPSPNRTTIPIPHHPIGHNYSAQKFTQILEKNYLWSNKLKFYIYRIMKY